MNSLLLFEKERWGDFFAIEDKERITHIQKVLKSRVGDILNICLVNKGIGKGVIQEISSQQIKIAPLQIQPRAIGRFELLIGLSRPHSSQKILEHGTSLGVFAFNFFTATLSEKSYLESKLFTQYEKYLLHGLSQSGLYHMLPTVTLSRNFQGHQKFILNPKSTKSFNDYDIDDRIITLAIGPERGFTLKEVEEFKEMGFQEVSLGPPILRVEIATFAALGQLHLKRKKYDTKN